MKLHEVQGRPEKLEDQILDFLAKYAKTKADFDPQWDAEEDRFNGPDSSMLYAAAHFIKAGHRPERVHSNWESGCYAPEGERQGRDWHDELVRRVNQLAM